eukprot:gnl/TRDRNA2_/TRDRNA2_167096_c1_seq1.p1 gnl/TRDRNA2_/TRDRNA2_167096_c1~~gnl/TRDRNA2_/TRDRNA2_167096_c1_seq1.p1  ORF type:complete len:614 (+),score=113.14 gnl/TRDRNA2_/TRDRNA2_167096_c1_seq1:69-1910(+)
MLDASGQKQSTTPAAHVATCFVRQYYGCLSKNPSQLSKFYKAQSVFSFSRAAEGSRGVCTSAVGQAHIHAEIMNTLRPFQGQPIKVEILGTDSQESRQGGVLVLVTGYLCVTATGMIQHFTQSFFLDKQTHPCDGFYVLDDILRYLPPAVGSCNPPMAQAQPTFMAMPPQPLAPMMMPEPTAKVDTTVVDQAQAEWMAEEDETANRATDQPPEGETREVQTKHPDETEVEVELDIEGEDEEENKDSYHREHLKHLEGADGQEEQPDAQEEEMGDDNEEEEEEYGEGDDQEDEEQREDAAGDNEQPEGGAMLDEATDDAAYAAFIQGSEPRTWASMAGGLGQGGGQLAPAKLQGFAYPAASQSSGYGLPAPQQGASASSSATGKGEGDKGKGKGRGKSEGSSRTATSNSSSSFGGHVWLWVSRLPGDQGIEGKEILDCFNNFLAEANIQGRAAEVDRKDTVQEWCGISVTSQEAADTLVHLSKERKLQLRGKVLKAEPHRGSYNSGFRRGPGRGAGGGSNVSGREGMGKSAGMGSGRGGGGGGGGSAAAEWGGGDDDERGDRGGDGRSGGKPRRRPRGGGGAPEGRDRTSPSEASPKSGESGSRGGYSGRPPRK